MKVCAKYQICVYVTCALSYACLLFIHFVQRTRILKQKEMKTKNKQKSMKILANDENEAKKNCMRPVKMICNARSVQHIQFFFSSLVFFLFFSVWLKQFLYLLPPK